MERSKTPPILRLDEVDSTNNYAAKLIGASFVQDGTVILTKRQSQGRGQRGTSWQSEPGKNITMTYICQWEAEPKEVWRISAAAGMALMDVVEAIGLDVRLKWPNDLVTSPDLKKLAGILIENKWEGMKLKWVLVGVGLNVNQRTFDVPGASSLVLAAGVTEDLDIGELSMDLQASLMTWMERVESGEFSKKEYLDRLVGVKEYLAYRELVTAETFKARVVDVTHEGDLVLALPDGTTRAYRNKEVELIRTP